MNLHKLVKHDLRCGLLRPRYLWTPLFFIVPCLLCSMIAASTGLKCHWFEYLLFCFMGIEPIEIMDTMEKAQLPVFWLVSIGGSLFLNLDYLLNDLSHAGQQMVIRSGKRINWYFAKCIWNLCSCAVYFIFAGLTIAIFTFIMGGTVKLSVNMDLLYMIYQGTPEVESLSSGSALLIGIVLPYLSVSALSLLQMTLCLVIKPVFGFLTSMLLLLLSVYWKSSLILGNGAMAIRSICLVPNGINPWIVMAECIVIIVSCVVIGSRIFNNSDILGAKE